MSKDKCKDKKNKRLPSTSKLVLAGVILICLQIIFFSEFMMYTFQDTSSMYVLIGIPATLIPIVWAYYSKAKAENTAGGITYDMAMKEKESEFSCEIVSEEESPI